jgi:hypothetical protein
MMLSSDCETHSIPAQTRPTALTISLDWVITGLCKEPPKTPTPVRDNSCPAKLLVHTVQVPLAHVHHLSLLAILSMLSLSPRLSLLFLFPLSPLSLLSPLTPHPHTCLCDLMVLPACRGLDRLARTNARARQYPSGKTRRRCIHDI